ncbi:GntR family transcriptional regulator [Propionimicrobium sp. PCR01-08-3]|uniref:GntR family transcriptional regulator n=1 Tax=Propionimicrobium sp. PCR01-08-3 TaxID=3052086 RepID=UPI00255C9E7A|nr:GntR family transcriptional regulator [Propionimicrobium sp. PCR01-08-3]WIY81893.1 GntR family transcriptional regulator [Propionimicrobium sp. PCR01-08-3]
MGDGTKGDLAYRGIRDLILSGKLAAGDIIPQREIAAGLGISTTPLREGLRRLESEGLITLESHRTARVTELRLEQARDLLEIRRSLDPLAASLAAERRTREDIAAIRECGTKLRALPVNATVDELIAHRRFHRSIYCASHNELLIGTLDTLWDKADRYRMMALKIDRGQQARDLKDKEHRLLVQYIAAGDSSSAAKVMLHHIDTSLVVEAISRLASGRDLAS